MEIPTLKKVAVIIVKDVPFVVYAKLAVGEIPTAPIPTA